MKIEIIQLLRSGILKKTHIQDILIEKFKVGKLKVSEAYDSAFSDFSGKPLNPKLPPPPKINMKPKGWKPDVVEVIDVEGTDTQLTKRGKVWRPIYKDNYLKDVIEDAVREPIKAKDLNSNDLDSDDESSRAEPPALIGRYEVVDERPDDVMARAELMETLTRIARGEPTACPRTGLMRRPDTREVLAALKQLAELQGFTAPTKSKVDFTEGSVIEMQKNLAKLLASPELKGVDLVAMMRGGGKA